MCCARRTARGQWGQVGVANTLMVTSSVKAGQGRLRLVLELRLAA